MKLLALDLSSACGSVALLNRDDLLAEEPTQGGLASGHQVYSVVGALLSRVGWKPGDLDQIVVGRGPGSYTGLRIAIAYAQGLSAPKRIPIYAVKSSEALAFEFRARARMLAVLGDARRGAVWIHRFDASRFGFADSLVQEDVVPYERAQELLSETPFVSPEWTRLQKVNNAMQRLVPLVPEDCYPKASALGRLALMKMQKGIESEPLLPIYLHPPVDPTKCSR